MALTLTVGAFDVTAAVLFDSLTVKFNTADFALIDPGLGGGGPALGTAVTIVDPVIGLNWSGTIAAWDAHAATQKASGHVIEVITATNAAVAVANTAPFDLSDVAGDATDIITTEAGDELITETGASHILTEGYRRVPYQDYSIKTSAPLSGPTSFVARATVWQPGLAVGQTVHAVNADFAAATIFSAGADWYINEVTITWQGVPRTPVYTVQMGAIGVDVTPFTFRHFVGLP